MDKQYLLSRMRVSLAMAEKTSNAPARLVHYDLARRYSAAAAAEDEDLRPQPS